MTLVLYQSLTVPACVHAYYKIFVEILYKYCKCTQKNTNIFNLALNVLELNVPNVMNLFHLWSLAVTIILEPILWIFCCYPIVYVSLIIIINDSLISGQTTLEKCLHVPPSAAHLVPAFKHARVILPNSRWRLLNHMRNAPGIQCIFYIREAILWCAFYMFFIQLLFMVVLGFSTQENTITKAKQLYSIAFYLHFTINYKIINSL